MKLTIEGTKEEIKELLQANQGSEEQKNIFVNQEKVLSKQAVTDEILETAARLNSLANKNLSF